MSSMVWLAWIRGLPRLTVLAVCAALAAAVAMSLTAVGAPVWMRIAAAAVVMVLVVGSELDKLHTKNQEKKGTEREKAEGIAAAETVWQQSVRNSLRVWPAPRVVDVDPYALGVKRSRLAERDIPTDVVRPPPYVDRDIDKLARTRLQGTGMLLIIGSPASGVTRTAYQQALAVPTALVLAPAPPDGLKTALDDLDVLSRYGPPTQLVLWLDRIDTFSAQGLTVEMLRRCRARSPGLRVVATIPAGVRYSVWETEKPSMAAEFGDPVMLERLPSGDELARASGVYPGIDFSEGIAAAFASEAALLVRIRAGHDTCPFEPAGGDCALARSVVHTTIGWGGTTTPRPLLSSRLAALLQERLGQLMTLADAHLAEALIWAATPVVEGAALVHRSIDNQGEQIFEAHHQLVELRQAEGTAPTEAVWLAALDDAASAKDSSAIGRIGFRAHITNKPDIAERAWANVAAIDESAAEWLTRAAEYSRKRHELTAEILPRQRLLELTELSRGPDSIDFARTLIHLGNAWYGLSQPAIACKMYERALTIYERELGPDHPDVAGTLSNLGNTWRDLGQPDTARKIYERALTIEEHEFGPNSIGAARTLNNLGAAWSRLGRPDTARAMHERALTIREHEFGPDHPDVAMTLTNLGAVWGSLGRPDTARTMLERALTIKEREFGPNSTEVAGVLSNLGSVWVHLGQPDTARTMLERALTIREREFGPDHPVVATTLTNLGRAWDDLGQPDTARTMHERALTIKEREFGPNSTEVAGVLNNLGSVWRDLEQPDTARTMLERALTIAERELGPNSNMVAGILNNLGNAWLDLGQPDTARKMYERAARILHANFPGGHPLTKIVARSMRLVAQDVIIRDDGMIFTRAEQGDDVDRP